MATKSYNTETVLRGEQPKGQASKARRGLFAAPWVRSGLVLAALVAVWEGLVRAMEVNPFLFPSASSVFVRFVRDIGITGEATLIPLIGSTLSLVLQAYFVSVVLAHLLTGLAVTSVWVREFLKVITGMFQPLPAIALLPIAILWFGLSRESIIFVVIMSMLWPLTASLTTGFAVASPTLLRLGANYELSKMAALFKILLPQALPSLIGGLRVSWGYGWRAVVGAELVFGATGGQAGLGAYINVTRMRLDTEGAFTALLTIILIGLAVEALFRLVQRHTTEKWGMERSASD